MITIFTQCKQVQGGSWILMYNELEALNIGVTYVIDIYLLQKVNKIYLHPIKFLKYSSSF